MGRGITPDENDIFKPNSQDNEGVDTVTTGGDQENLLQKRG